MDNIKETILIYPPNKIKDDVFFSKIMSGETEITFQVPKAKITLDRSKNKSKIVLDEKCTKIIKNISKAVVKETSKQSLKFFEKEISYDDCHDLYREALVEDNVLNCFYDDNIYIYDKNGEIKLTDLEDEFVGIILLKGDVVVYTKTAFYIRWEIQQIKVKTQKEKSQDIFLKEYYITDLDKDNIPIENENEIIGKKLKELTLF